MNDIYIYIWFAVTSVECAICICFKRAKWTMMVQGNNLWLLCTTLSFMLTQSSSIHFTIDISGCLIVSFN